jgi:hypothetical protein
VEGRNGGPGSEVRPWELVDPSVALVLRPALPGLADEIVEAIRSEVPAYARSLDGALAATVRRGVEEALAHFVRRIDEPGAPQSVRPEMHVELGRAEFRANRSLDGLLAAYRLGARLSWRRLVAHGQEAGLAPPTLYQLGEAIFEYIDELSAASAEGYAEEQAATAQEAQLRRHSLVRLLVGQHSPDPAGVKDAARAAGWALPARLAALAFAGDDPERVARRLGADVVAAPVDGLHCALIPDPGAPGRRAALARALADVDAALGHTVRWLDAAHSLGRARLALGLAQEAVIPADGLVVADDHLATLVLHGDRQLASDLARARLGPLEETEAKFRGRLEETLRVWLDRHGRVPDVAEALHVHPQTVRYRLGRLRTLFGDALDDPDARFELQLALHAKGPADG